MRRRWCTWILLSRVRFAVFAAAHQRARVERRCAYARQASRQTYALLPVSLSPFRQRKVRKIKSAIPFFFHAGSSCTPVQLSISPRLPLPACMIAAAPGLRWCCSARCCCKRARLLCHAILWYFLIFWRAASAMFSRAQRQKMRRQCQALSPALFVSLRER